MSLLNLQDLETMEQIIRVCQSRGAFTMEETPPVFNVLQKIQQCIAQEKSKKSLPSIPEEKTN